MDELLRFMESDFAGGTENIDEDDGDAELVDSPSCRASLSPLKSQNHCEISSPASSQPQRNVSFQDIFGSPDKRDLTELGLSRKKSSPKRYQTISNKPTSLSASSSQQTESSFAQSSNRQFELSKAIRSDNNVPFKPDTNLTVIDPYSRVRILKSTISFYYDESMSADAALKDRNLGLEFVSLSSFSVWYRGKGKDQKNFWVSGVLVRKTAGVRKSAKGNDYSVWELSDLKDLDKKISVFLFGSASSSLSATPVGTVVDLTTPSVLQDASGTVKLSVSNSTQVRFIAQAKDFGYCHAKKKDGNNCTAVVNTWECSFCIYHASSELKKLNVGSGGRGKGKIRSSYPNKSFTGNGGYGSGDSQESLKQQGVFIADFGARPLTSGKGAGGLERSRSFGGKSSQQKIVTSRPNLPPSSRMALQGGVNQMNKNPVKFGNPDTVQFFSKGSEQHPLLKQEGGPIPVVKKPLDLNPNKTRHLTDKDRELLLKLDSSMGATDNQEESKCMNEKTESSSAHVVSELITSSIVSNPNAASRNFMQFLSLQHAPKDQVDLNSTNKSSTIQPMVMSRAKLKCMEKALDFVKKNGPIQKTDPNSTSSGRKRKLGQTHSSAVSSSSAPSTTKKRASTQIDVEFDFDSDDFKKILNAKSAHDEELDQIQHEEYFDKLEKKEALENKLLNTFAIETNAVMCRQCKYVALSQSDFCKEQLHQVRLVKARKRFFKCKDCGNRTMSLDRLPKRPCPNCNNSSWLVAPVGKERKGPTLPSEMLAVRGHEEKFIGSAGAKHFMHLDV